MALLIPDPQHTAGAPRLAPEMCGPQTGAPSHAGKQASPTPSARAQFGAIAFIRWRMFANSFRRRTRDDRQLSSLLLGILLRLIVWPILALVFLGPVAACAFLGYVSAAHNRFQQAPLLLATVFALWQFAALNGAGVSSQHIRAASPHPLSYPISPLYGHPPVHRPLDAHKHRRSAAMLAAAIGIGLARHTLLLPALASLGLYALCNILFARMVDAWLDRWLATRRAREISGALTVVWVVAVNVFSSHAAGRHARMPMPLLLARHSAPYLHWLPPGLASGSIAASTGHPLLALADLAALLGWAALILALFAVRLHKQFLGELLAEGSPARTRAGVPRPAASPAIPQVASSQPDKFTISPVLAACFRKEWLYYRSSAARLYGPITSIFFIYLLTGPTGLLGHHPAYALPGALAYALFAPLSGLFNTFGADGPGVQLYLLAPARMRDVLLAKNLFQLAQLLIQIAIAWLVVLFRSTASVPAAVQVSTAFWAAFVLFLCLRFGNSRSIQAPRYFIPGQQRATASAGKPASRSGALVTLGILFGTLLVAFPVTWLAHSLRQPWLPAAVFAPCAALAFWSYTRLLQNADRLVLDNRDLFATELCRT